MRKFLTGFAYFLIITSPIQIGFLLWIIGIVITTDYSLISLTGYDFFREYLTIFYFVYEWLYTWAWHVLLNFMFGLPVAAVVTLKLITNSCVAVWILSVTRQTERDGTTISLPDY
ncbi:MAG: hypothetical protein P8J55_13260 [Pseudomonadales bacterium]|nr:hypothetical protein [Pseudomonadales bacterium]